MRQADGGQDRALREIPACSGYPECKFTKSFQVKIGLSARSVAVSWWKGQTRRSAPSTAAATTRSASLPPTLSPSPALPQVRQPADPYREKWAKCTKCKYKGKLEEAMTRRDVKSRLCKTVFNRYINYLEAERNASPYTVRNYTTDLLDFFDFLRGQRRLVH